MATKQKTGETVTDAMEKLQAAGLGSVNKMGSVWLKDMAALNSEVLGFVADRIREDIRTQQEIMHCKDLGDLQRIQAKFVRTAIEQYTEETGKLVELGSRMLAHAGAELKHTEDEDPTRDT